MPREIFTFFPKRNSFYWKIWCYWRVLVRKTWSLKSCILERQKLLDSSLVPNFNVRKKFQTFLLAYPLRMVLYGVRVGGWGWKGSKMPQKRSNFTFKKRIKIYISRESAYIRRTATSFGFLSNSWRIKMRCEFAYITRPHNELGSAWKDGSRWRGQPKKGAGKKVEGAYAFFFWIVKKKKVERINGMRKRRMGAVRRSLLLTCQLGGQ